MAFQPPLSLRANLRLLHPRNPLSPPSPVCPQVRRRQRVSSPCHASRHVRRPWRSCASDGPVALDPPNAEADWVVVDMRAEGVAPDKLGADASLDALTDDAKSLVRVALRDAAVEMSVLLCSDSYIRQLNAQYRGKDAATDVLSFPQNDPDGVVLGDVIVSIDTAAAQAAERGLRLRDEIRVLLVHGLLHLLGYDHEGETDGDWLVMAQMENRFLGNLGWKAEGLVSVSLPEPYRNIVQPP